MLDESKFFKNPIGKSGTSIASGVYTEEYLTSLQGHEAAQVYDKMRRSDPKVRGILSAIINPIKRALWDVEPASDETKDIEVAALIKHILFKDIDWVLKLHEILTFIYQGYSVFEPIHENKESKEFGQYTGLNALAFRHQTTLTEWDHDTVTGHLKRIHQEQSGDVEVDVWLPVENLLTFFNEKEGDNNGFPLLRPLYGPYRRKLLCEELKIIGIERFAIPSPLMQVPSGIKTTDAEYEAAAAVLDAFTSAENSYIMYPEGWELDLHNNTFDPEKVQSTIKAEDEQMSISVVANFLELGIGGNGGAYALGTDLSDFFLNVIEHFASILTNVINSQLVSNLVLLNYGDTVGVLPQLTYSGINDKAGKELMEVVTGYTNSGVVGIDEQLEDHIRKVNNLPKKAGGEILDNQETQDDTTNNDDTGDNNDDNTSGDTTQLKDNIKLAEPKTARGLITESSLKLRELMQDRLTFISEKLIADIMSRYSQLSDGQKIRATDNVKVGGQAKYKRELKGLLTGVASKSIDQAQVEVPVKGVTLKDDMDRVFQLVSKREAEKIQKEFAKLPAHVRALLVRRAGQTVDQQVVDLENGVKFQYQSSISSTQDPNIIKQDMEGNADKYIAGGTVQRGAANNAAFAVNEARNAWFFDDEVSKQVHSMTFINTDPKAEICRTLAGETFAQDDAEFLRYNPPLHHNCKSYLRANLTTSKNLPEINSTLPSISKTAQESITLKEV